MKDETAITLLETGEHIHRDDVGYMLDLILTLLEKASENEFYLSIAVGVIGVWRESLDEQESMEASEASLKIIMGRTS